MDYKKQIAELIKIDGVTTEEIYSSLAPTPDLTRGDLCLPCFKFSRALRLAPPAIAQKLKDGTEFSRLDFISDVKIDGGYLNFYFNREKVVKDAIETLNRTACRPSAWPRSIPLPPA